MEKKMLPKWFQKLYWWGNSSKLDLETHKRTVVSQTINYGRWEHWQWLIQTYGKGRLKNIIQSTPASEFRPRALKLISLLLGIKKLPYASRSDYIKAKRNSR